MKTITCREMGGMCDAPVSGETPEEIMNKGMEHLEEAHPEMAEQVKATPKDDPAMVKWNEDFQKTWENKPEDQ